jgi:hypothetical protein
MTNKTTFVLALAAGFLGGIVSQHIMPPPVYAQAQSPVPREIRAESFVIVDTNGVPRGAFAVNGKNGRPTLEMRDRSGRLNETRWQVSGFYRNRPAQIIPPQ